MSSIGTLTIDIAANVARLQADMNAVKNQVGGAMSGIGNAADMAKKAFAALGGAMVVGSFVKLVGGALESTAALDDLSKQTGASASALSALAAVGRTTGTTAEEIAGMMGKLAKGMAGADEDSKGAAAAIKALGLDFDAFKKLSPDQQMLTVAKAMDGFADSAEKGVIMQILFGKGAEAATPYMKDLAEKGKLQAEATDEQSAAADQFLDNLTELNAAGAGWSKELANGMAPALADASSAFLDVFTSSGGLRDQLHKLAADGTIAEWTRMAVTGMTYVMDAVTGVWRTFRVLGEYIGGSVAAFAAAFSAIGGAATKAFSGDFKGAIAEAKTGVQQWNQITTEMGENISKIWSEKTMGQAVRERMKEIEKLGKTVKDNKPNIDTSGLHQNNAKAAKAEKEELAKLVNVQDIEVDILKALKKEHDDQFDAVRKETDEIRKQIDEQRKANEETGLSTEALGELEVQRLRDAAATAERNALLADETLINGDIAAQYRQQAAGLRELAELKAEGIHLKAAQESAAEWRKTTDQINESMTDALFRAFEEGKSLGKSFMDTLESSFKTLVLRPTLDIVMKPIQDWMGGIFKKLGGGSLMQTIGGAMVGSQVGDMLSGGYGSGTTTAIAAGLGAIAGGPIGALVGGAIGGVVNRLFGRKPKKVTEAGFVGEFIDGDFSGQQYADWKKKGGLFRSTKRGTDFSALSGDLAAALDQGGAAVFSAVTDYANALKLPADALARVNHQIKVQLTEDEAENQRRIEEAFAGYQNALSSSFEDVLRPFQEAGETIAETMQRLAEVQAFSETMNEFGGVFSRVAVLGLRAKEELIGFAGGIEALVAKTSSFVDNYYSDAEKFGIGARQIQEQLAALGITGNISSRADFRALVEGTDVSTTEGRQMLADLLTLAQSFAPVAQYLEQNGGTLADLAAQAPSTSIVESVLNDQEVLAEYQQRTADGVDLLNGSVLSIGERISQAIAAGNADLLAALIAIARNTADTTRKLDEWDAGGSMTTTAA